MAHLVNAFARVFAPPDNAKPLLITAATASCLTAAAVLSAQAWQRRVLSPCTPPSQPLTDAPSDAPYEAKDALGPEAYERLRRSFVIVVGAGGVGSWAALMLLRAGVQRIRIIDFDQVTLSSLNRHAVATLNDVGTPKVTAIKKHFRDISPQADVDSRIELFTAETADELLSGSPDFIIDAIDNINTKLYLIKYCHDRSLPVVSSMGAGAKADPSRIQIADISETLEDQLARAVRQKLKKMGVKNGVPVVYSAEKPHHVKLLPLEEDRVQDADDYAALPEFRSRILPVLGTIPSMFGMAIAEYVILKLAKRVDFEPLVIKLREGLYTRIHRDLLSRELKIYHNKTCTVDARDVGHIFEETWQGKSIFTGPSDRIALVRWDRSKPPSPLNLVCMTREEAKAHDALPIDTDLVAHYGQDICSYVDKRFANERRIHELWDPVF
ncbi:hypothetical protein BCR43DRAFT_528386 [Syncephalastrum racemosum]|uniref:THIF-type NAD/FAD binding fold domain-containing protein n=1 Tax=Syncephalastrum racemosum TaxID=13706 RepID=A0A1X2GYY6_SYNRA|nr:hypothetical protein BCR43DRAFT_528386 [Syncephalastrum racemosum]